MSTSVSMIISVPEYVVFNLISLILPSVQNYYRHYHYICIASHYANEFFVRYFGTVTWNGTTTIN